MNKINIYCEENYRETTWFKLIVKGIRSGLNPKKEDIEIVSELSNLKANTIVIIVGFTNRFIIDSLNFCLSNSLRPLLVGSSQNFSNFFNVSCIGINREAAMFDNVMNLINDNAKRIAIIGINPSVRSDLAHLNGYKCALKAANIKLNENDIYTNTIGIKDTITRFLKNVNKYDAVVCTNDYVAIMLLSKLREAGIDVPNKLQVTGAGNIDISKFARPSLTTIAIPLEDIGKQTITIYHLLIDNPSFKSLNSSFEHHIIYRDSTSIKEYKKYSMDVSNDSYQPLLEEGYESDMKPIWTISDAYSEMDEIDRKIIHGIINNLTNSETANEAFVADSTLRYRLKRIYQITNTNGKQELKDLILKYLKPEAF